MQSFEQARTVLVRNEHFKRDNTKVELDEIQFHTLSSSDKRYYSLVASKIDACDQVSRNDLAPLVREGYLTPTRDPFSLVYFDFNLEHPVLKNISVRRAIARAVERGTIVPYYLQGTSDALGYLPALFRTRDEDLLNPYYRRDTGTAQSLLAAANYKNEAIECYYPVDVSLPWMSTPQVIYSQLIGSLIEVGLNIKPVPLGWAEYCEKAHSNGAERGMVLGGFYGAYRDPYAFLGPVLAPLLVAQWLNEKDPNRAKSLPRPRKTLSLPLRLLQARSLRPQRVHRLPPPPLRASRRAPVHHLPKVSRGSPHRPHHQRQRLSPRILTRPPHLSRLCAIFEMPILRRTWKISALSIGR